MAPRRSLVMGASGFLGSHVTRQLVERGDDVRVLLREFPRLGPVGADIFCREAQGVWPELRPALDGKVLDGARAVGLPHDAGRIAALVGDEELVVLAAALVRVGLDDALAAEVRG